MKCGGFNYGNFHHFSKWWATRWHGILQTFGILIFTCIEIIKVSNWICPKLWEIMYQYLVENTVFDSLPVMNDLHLRVSLDKNENNVFWLKWLDIRPGYIYMYRYLLNYVSCLVVWLPIGYNIVKTSLYQQQFEIGSEQVQNLWLKKLRFQWTSDFWKLDDMTN